MRISVFADASYAPDTRRGGWGVYIRSSLHHWKGSGVLVGIGSAGQLKDNVEAEMQAAAIGIWQALKIAAPGDRLLVQVDCLSAIDYFEDKVTRPDKLYAQIVDKVRAWTAKAGVDVEWRHVRGHNAGDGTPRSWVNDWCDRAARMEMRKAQPEGHKSGQGERNEQEPKTETSTGTGTCTESGPADDSAIHKGIQRPRLRTGRACQARRLQVQPATER